MCIFSYTLQMSNSMIWTQIHKESIKDACLQHVKFNQPIPLDVLNNSQVVLDNTTGVPVTQLPINVFDAQILQTIRDASCTNDCSGNGQCIEGKPNCNDVELYFVCKRTHFKLFHRKTTCILYL